MEYIAAAIIALMTSTASAIAGGGGGLLGAPALLLLGFSPNVVVATQKAGGIGVNVGAMSRFYNKKDLVQWRFGLMMSAIAIVASYVGTKLIFELSEETIRNAVASVTLVIVPIMLLNKNAGIKRRVASNIEKIIGTTLYTIVLTIQAGIGSGTGTFAMFVMMGPMGFTALQANATKRLVGFVLTVSSMGFFISSGFVDWKLAGVLLIAEGGGGFIGAGLAIEHGSAFVKKTLITISVVMALFLLLN